jgi:hypothetical protein
LINDTTLPREERWKEGKNQLFSSVEEVWRRSKLILLQKRSGQEAAISNSSLWGKRWIEDKNYLFS